jgi:hypothetical protein
MIKTLRVAATVQIVTMVEILDKIARENIMHACSNNHVVVIIGYIYNSLGHFLTRGDGKHIFHHLG